MFDDVPTEFIHDSLHNQLDDLVKVKCAQTKYFKYVRETHWVNAVSVKYNLRATRVQRQLEQFLCKQCLKSK